MGTCSGSRRDSVAAANTHTVVVSESGEVFTWGCIKEDQLGYGTSNSRSNYTLRLIEYLKGKGFIGVAATKYHTIVLGADGEGKQHQSLSYSPKARTTRFAVTSGHGSPSDSAGMNRWFKPNVDAPHLFALSKSKRRL